MTVLAAILLTLLANFSLLALLWYSRRNRGGSLGHLKGPESSSFWLGILHNLHAPQYLTNFIIIRQRDRYSVPE